MHCTQVRDIYYQIVFWPHNEVFSWMKMHPFGPFWPTLRSSGFSVPAKTSAVAILALWAIWQVCFSLRDEETGQPAQTSLTHVSFTHKPLFHSMIFHFARSKSVKHQIHSGSSRSESHFVFLQVPFPSYKKNSSSLSVLFTSFVVAFTRSLC